MKKRVVDRNSIWLTVVVALIVAVVASLGTATITGGAFFGGSKDGASLAPKVGSAYTNSHACRADAVCETNALLVNNEQGIGIDFACLDSIGKITRMEVNCEAANDNICSEFSRNVVTKVIGDFTSGLGFSDGRKVIFNEGAEIHLGDRIVIPETYIELDDVYNDTVGFSDDVVKFVNVLTGDLYDTSWSSEGVGVITINGVTYTVYLEGDSDTPTEEYIVTLNYPQTNTGRSMDLTLCF